MPSYYEPPPNNLQHRRLPPAPLHQHHKTCSPSPRTKSNPLPNRRTEEPARSGRIRIRHLDGRVQVIHVVVRDADAPPGGHGGVCEVEGEDDDDGGDGEADVEAGGGDVVEAHPPAAVAVPDVLVEDEADDAPGEVVERGGGGDAVAAAEDERGGEVAEGRAGEGAGEGVEEDGGQGAGQPEVLQVGVQGARGEDALRADEAPDDRGVEEDAPVGAVELAALVFGADVRDRAAEGPFEHPDLHDAGPDGGDGLRHEHGSPWDLHILAEFEILGEVEALSHGDVAVGLEEHHGHRTAGLDVSGYEFPV